MERTYDEGRRHRGMLQSSRASASTAGSPARLVGGGLFVRGGLFSSWRSIDEIHEIWPTLAMHCSRQQR